MNSDITEQFLDKLYDDLSKEQSRILNDIKTDRSDTKEKDQYQVNDSANKIKSPSRNISNNQLIQNSLQQP